VGRNWKPSIADQLEDVASSLLDVAFAVAAIAEQLREGVAFSYLQALDSRIYQDRASHLQNPAVP